MLLVAMTQIEPAFGQNQIRISCIEVWTPLKGIVNDFQVIVPDLVDVLAPGTAVGAVVNDHKRLRNFDNIRYLPDPNPEVHIGEGGQGSIKTSNLQQ